jgi:hypothetical protein
VYNCVNANCTAAACCVADDTTTEPPTPPTTEECPPLPTGADVEAARLFCSTFDCGTSLEGFSYPAKLPASIFACLGGACSKQDCCHFAPLCTTLDCPTGWTVRPNDCIRTPLKYGFGSTDSEVNSECCTRDETHATCATNLPVECSSDPSAKLLPEDVAAKTQCYFADECKIYECCVSSAGAESCGAGCPPDEKDALPPKGTDEDEKTDTKQNDAESAGDSDGMGR